MTKKAENNANRTLRLAGTHLNAERFVLKKNWSLEVLKQFERDKAQLKWFKKLL